MDSVALLLAVTPQKAIDRLSIKLKKIFIPITTRSSRQVLTDHPIEGRETYRGNARYPPVHYSVHTANCIVLLQGGPLTLHFALSPSQCDFNYLITSIERRKDDLLELMVEVFRRILITPCECSEVITQTIRRAPKYMAIRNG